MIHDYCTAFKPYGKIQGAAAGHPKPLWPEVMRVSSQTATPDTTSCTYAPRRVSVAPDFTYFSKVFNFTQNWTIAKLKWTWRNYYWISDKSFCITRDINSCRGSLRLWKPLKDWRICFFFFISHFRLRQRDIVFLQWTVRGLMYLPFLPPLLPSLCLNFHRFLLRKSIINFLLYLEFPRSFFFFFFWSYILKI